MKQEDIIRMAREAGFWQEHTNTWMCGTEDIATLVALVEAAATEAANARANTSWTLMCKKMVEAEREACAKVCESAREAIWEYHDEPLKAAACNTCTNIADAIRARGAEMTKENTLQEQLAKAYADRNKAKDDWIKANDDRNKANDDWVKAYAEGKRVEQLIKDQT